MTGAPALARERTITDREFRLFQRLIEEESGIFLSDAKRALLVGRLNRRMRELSMPSFGAYYDFVIAQGEDETTTLLDCVCTNETHFFREPKHFEFVENVAAAAWRKARADGRISPDIRVWSAACSTGEEPYSIAMSLRTALPESEGWRIDILASDLSTRVLERAQSGLFPIDKATEIPRAYLKSYMYRGVRSNEGLMAVSREIASLVRFSRINLHDDPLAVGGVFDLIFCRNVLIYFDADEKRRVVSRLLTHLRPGGYLFLGHAESVAGDPRLILSGPTIYRMKSAAGERQNESS